jgi:hypothetical protein
MPEIGKGLNMRKMGRLLLVLALTMPLLTTGCVPHRQAYVWGPGEQTYYVQWENETHRQHRDWNQRSQADHNAYWKWRKHHHDHD